MQIYRDLSAVSSSRRFRVWTLARLWCNKLAISVVDPPGAARVSSLGSDGQVSNMTDTSQCFSTKTVSTNRSEVFECLQLGGGEAFAEDGQVVSLSRR